LSILDLNGHRVRHGDVMDADGISTLMGSDRAAIMYSDPPWGEGNIRYWATMNRKMTGEEIEPAGLDAFLGQIFKIASAYVDDFLLIEYGVRWKDLIQKRGVAAGFSPWGIADVFYRGGSKLLPLHLHVFTRYGAQVPSGYLAAVNGTHGFATVRAAIAPLASRYASVAPPRIVLDPCCGMGYTARAAVECGLRFRGNELNKARLAKTIQRLR